MGNSSNLQPQYEQIPKELRGMRSWVIWRYEQRDDSPTKVPHTTMGYHARVDNPDHWSTFENACRAAARPAFAEGIGFVFSADDPYCGIDLDHIWLSDADEGCPEWARQILERFSDTYWEESPSGAGVKIWCRAQLPPICKHNWPIAPGKQAIEIYDKRRFFAVTGRSNGVLTIVDHQHDIDELLVYLGTGGAMGAPERIPDQIPYGTQHNTLVSLAGTMCRRGMCAEAIEAALQVVNAQQCERPGPPENIRKIADSARRWSR